MKYFEEEIYEYALTKHPDLKDCDELKDIINEIVNKIYDPNLDIKYIKKRFDYSFSYWGTQKVLLSDNKYQTLKKKRLDEIIDCNEKYIIEKMVDRSEKYIFNSYSYQKYLLDEVYWLLYDYIIEKSNTP